MKLVKKNTSPKKITAGRTAGNMRDVACRPTSRASERARAKSRPSKADKSSSQKGLVSTDRSKATALPSTTPRRKPRSSTNDFAPLHSPWECSRFRLEAPAVSASGTSWPSCRGSATAGAEGRSARAYSRLPTQRH